MFSGEYGWMPKKKIKPKVKLFGGDDFKFFIFISIFIFCLAGLVLLITGIYLLPKPTSYLFFAGEDFEAISSFIIGLGSCVLLGSALGVYGVFNDISSLIYLYSFFLFCIITAQGAVTVSAVTVSYKIDVTLHQEMIFSIEEYKENSKNTETMAWNIMQSSLHCCGINNYTDWLLLPSLTVPSSCQRNVTIPTDYKEYGENPFFTDGCYGIVKKRLDTDMMIINSCCICFILLELVGIAVISSNTRS